MNRILSRKSFVEVYPKTLFQTKLVTINPKPKAKFFFGAQVTINSDNAGFAPSLIYQSKKRSTFSFSYDILNKNYMFGFYWPLSFKRR